MNLFVQSVLDDRVLFVSWFVTVVVSITLHELAHGAVAIWRGDDTPRQSGHMTVNPLVHMGLWSLIMLLVAGVAWGQMPVDSTRLRGRFSEALVAAAGPLTNLLLALVGLTILGLWERWGAAPETVFWQNVQQFLLIFGCANMVLCLFNLVPLPPLDGSRVLANLNGSYAALISNPGHQGTIFLGFILMFAVVGNAMFGLGQSWAVHYLNWLNAL